MFTNIGHMAPCVPTLCPKCVSPSGLPGTRPTRLQRAEKSVSGGRRPPSRQGSFLTGGEGRGGKGGRRATPRAPSSRAAMRGRRRTRARRAGHVWALRAAGPAWRADGAGRAAGALPARGVPRHVGVCAIDIAGGAGGGQRPRADDVV